MVYLLCFSLTYVRVIAPVYDYIGLAAHPVDWQWLVLAVGFALLPLAILSARWRGPLEASPWVFYLIAYLPACLVPLLAFPDKGGLGWKTPLGMLTGLATLCLFLRLPLPAFNVRITLVRHRVVALCLVLAAGAFALMLFAAADYSLRLEFGSHYDRRFAAREITQTAPWLGYGSAWLTFFFIPALAALAVARRAPWLAALGFLCGLIVFSFDGSKNWMLLAFVAAGATWRFRSSARPVCPAPFILGLAGMAALSLAEPWIISSLPYTDLLTRRILAVPAFLAGCYFDFFSQSPHLLYSDTTLINRFVPNPYGTSAGYVIGEIYLGTPGMNANAGIWPNGFAQAGLLGVVLYSLLAATILRFFHHQWRRHLHPLAPAAMTVSCFVWIETSIPTSISTAGLAFWLLVLMFPRRPATEVPAVAAPSTPASAHR